MSTIARIVCFFVGLGLVVTGFTNDSPSLLVIIIGFILIVISLLAIAKYDFDVDISLPDIDFSDGSHGGDHHSSD